MNVEMKGPLAALRTHAPRGANFEFVYYPDGGPREGIISYSRHASDASAKTKAGRMAKRLGLPVDLAVAGGADWDERYVTTASPSEFHATGYRFERLD